MIGYRYHPEARAEYLAALTWYRGRAPEAARGLAAAVEDGLRTVRAKPLAWPTWRGGPVRRRILPRVPYSLFFVVHDDAVIVLAVAHHRRRPGYWAERIAAP